MMCNWTESYTDALKRESRTEKLKKPEPECCCPKEKIDGYKIVNAGCKIHGIKAKYPVVPKKKW